MTRRGWLRLMAAGVLVVWLCLFLHWDSRIQATKDFPIFSRLDAVEHAALL